MITSVGVYNVSIDFCMMYMYAGQLFSGSLRKYFARHYNSTVI